MTTLTTSWRIARSGTTGASTTMTKFPLLALAARVALVRSASEIASERMVSRGGRILRGDHCRLKPRTLERLVLLVLNARAVGVMK